MTGWLKSLFVVMAFIDVCRGYSEGTWFEAQADCQNRGGSLPIHPSNTIDEMYQWVAYHKRLSPWIKILGCYKMNTSTTTVQTYKVRSVGECQSFCSAKNISIFGIQEFTCMCIDTLSDTTRLLMEKCNHNCTAKANTLPFNKCGEPSVFNVYYSGTLSELVPSEKNITCEVKQCGDDSRYLHGGQYNKRSGFSWGQSMENCITSGSQSYVLRDFHLGNNNQGCGLFSKTKGQSTWLRIANQIYLSHVYHRESILRDEKVLKCQKCSIKKKWGCDFENCSRKEKYHCKDVASSSSGTSRVASLTTTTRPTLLFGMNLTTLYRTKLLFGVNLTTLDTQVQETSPYDSNTAETVGKREIEDIFTATITVTVTQGDALPKATSFRVDTVVVIVVGVVAVVVVTVVVLLVVLFRRKTTQIHKQTKKHTKRSLKNAQNNAEMTATSTNYSTARSHNERLTEEESPYSRVEDGVYDHLRDNQARRKETENIYHHVSLVPSNYSEMNVLPTDRIDSIYNHCKSLQRTSQDNTYDRSNSFLRTSQDNTYDRSESFLMTPQDNTYDRSESFLKISQDNTYDRSESFQRTSQDNTYDRSESFQRTSQDNTYDRSESFLRTSQDNTYDRSESFQRTSQDNTYDRTESFQRTSQDNTYNHTDNRVPTVYSVSAEII